MMSTVKRHRTIKLPLALVESLEKFQKTDRAKKLGLHSITSTVEYFVRQGIDQSKV